MSTWISEERDRIDLFIMLVPGFTGALVAIIGDCAGDVTLETSSHLQQVWLASRWHSRIAWMWLGPDDHVDVDCPPIGATH